MPHLILKRASASRSSGKWNDDDYDVLADGAVVGRIFKANAAPVGMPWMWTLAFGRHEDRSPTHGYAAAPSATGSTVIEFRTAAGEALAILIRAVPAVNRRANLQAAPPSATA